MLLDGFDENFLKAVDRALSIKAKDRPQSVQEFQKDLAGDLVHTENTENVQSQLNNNYVSFIVFVLLIVGGFFYFMQEKMSQKVETPIGKMEKKTKVDTVQETSRNKKVPEQEAVRGTNEQAQSRAEEARNRQIEQEHLALEKELIRLKEAKLKAQRAEIARLKKEEAERIANKKRTEEKLQKSLEELKKIEAEKVKNYYSKLDTYYNGRFGFSLKYPINLLTKKEYPTNGDGVWLSNENGTVEVTPSAAFAWNISNAKQMYREALNWKEENRAMEVTYKRQKNNWYVLSGYDHSKNKIFYEKYYLNNGVRSGFSILFPIAEKKKYEKIVDIIAKSFKPSFGEQ
jgi:hypothetical protein